MIKQAVANTGLSVTPLCFGTSGLGNMPDTYGYEVDEERAASTLKAIFEGPVNFLDTSNIYGFGQSEERIGRAIHNLGGLPENFVISSKLDRDVKSGRFDAGRARQSLEESLSRLGLDSIPMLHLHDPEHCNNLDEITEPNGTLDTLQQFKSEGLTQAIGLAMGRTDMMLELLKMCPFDTMISHNRYTLINRSASVLFDYAHNNGIAILNAAPYAGGVFAKGSIEMPRVTYQLADDQTLAPVRIIEKLCQKHNVAPGALALQFSMKDPRIVSTIVGVSKPERVSQTLAWSQAEIPQAVWDELDNLEYSSEDPEANRDYKPG